ncbi:hypothetical protein EV1_024849 [Malus domestica]
MNLVSRFHLSPPYHLLPLMTPVPTCALQVMRFDRALLTRGHHSATPPLFGRRKQLRKIEAKPNFCTELEAIPGPPSEREVNGFPITLFLQLGFLLSPNFISLSLCILI